MLSDMGTAGLWGLWLWLCRPALGVLGWVRGASIQHCVTHLMAIGGASGLERGAFALCSACGVVWLWSKIVERGRIATRSAYSPNYAVHFGLSDLQLHRYRMSQVCIVHHDADGRISAIAPVEPTPPSAVDASAPSAGSSGERELAEAA